MGVKDNLVGWVHQQAFHFPLSLVGLSGAEELADPKPLPISNSPLVEIQQQSSLLAELALQRKWVQELWINWE